MRNMYRMLALLLTVFSMSYALAGFNPGSVKTSFANGDEVIIYGASADEYLAGFNAGKTSVVKTPKTTETNVFVLVEAEGKEGIPAFLLKQKSTELYLQVLSTGTLNMTDREGAATSFELVAAERDVTCTQWWPQGLEEYDAKVNFEELTLIRIDNLDEESREETPYQYVCSYWKGNSCFLASYTDTNAWVFYTVDTSARPDIAAILDEYPVSMFPGGSVPTTYPQELVDAYAAAYLQGEIIYNNPAASEEQLVEVYVALKAALDAVIDAMIPFSGYYRIVSGLPNYFETQYHEKAISDNGSILRWDSLDIASPRYAFKFDQQENGKYIIQNMLTERYIANGNGSSGTVNTGLTSQYEVTIAELLPTDGTVNEDEKQFALTPGGSSSYHLHTGGHGGGAGVSGNIVGWNGSFNTASAWYIRAINADELAALESIATQEQRNIKLNELITYGFEKYNLASVSVLGEEGLVWDASQFYSNADQNTTGSPDGGGYPALIDGDTQTFFHSSWSNGPRENHYLQVDLSEAPIQTFAFTFTRRMQNTANRPTNIRVSASNDGETWVSKWAIPSGLPTVAADSSYVSPVIDLGEAYNHVRFTVLSTNTGASSNGYPFFTFSEFQLYTATLSEDSPMNEFIEIANALKVELLKATSLENASQEDIDALEGAISDFMLELLDPTELQATIAAAEAQVAVASVGVDPGQYPEDALSILDGAIEDAKMALEDDGATKASYAAAVEALTAAMEQFRASLITTVQTNQWYYIKGSNQAKASMQGMYMYYRGGENDKLGFGELEEENDNYLWRLVALDDTLYAIQNLGNLQFLAPTPGGAGTRAATSTLVPGKYKITSLGGDAFNINEQGYLPLHGQDAGTVIVHWAGGIGSGSVWTFESAFLDEEPEELVAAFDGYTPGEYTTMCLPISLEGISNALAYSVSGAERNGEGNVTSISLKEIAGGVVPAGTPFILKAEDEEIVFAWGNEGTIEAGASNGLVGTFSSAILEAGYGYVAGDKVSVSNGAYVLGANRAYINELLITAQEDGDDFLEVDGLMTNIDEVVEADDQTNVNVYTTTGVLVRKDMKRSDAVKGLSKGFYIVGKTKVVVK